MFAKKALVLALLSICLSASAAPAADCVRAFDAVPLLDAYRTLTDYHANYYGEVLGYFRSARG